jgi:hypothetical protein
MSTTRRGLLRGALTGGVATLGLALVGETALADPTALLRGATTDTQLLSRLLDLEQLETFAYAHIGQTSVLPAKAKRAVAQFLGQEHRHAELLAAALSERGGTRPPPIASVAAADRKLASLAVSGRLDDVHDESAAVHLLIGLETAAEMVYYGAIERLASPALVDRAVGILGCEAQHWTGLSLLLHYHDPGRSVPHAFAPLVGQFSG